MGHSKDKNAEYIKKLRAMLKQLPIFIAEYMRGIEGRTSVQTRLAYAYDFRLFFDFLRKEVRGFDRDIREYRLEDLEAITATNLEEYASYLTLYYTEHEAIRENANAGKERKLSALRSLFKYYYKKEKLSQNIGELVDLPKIAEKPIIRLEADEIARILDAADSGAHLTERQKKYHDKTHLRDAALLTLLLGTGMRISECLDLNLADLDFSANACRITRKGGDSTILYFSDEVASALKAYIKEREKVEPAPGHQNAVFLSLQKKRITSRAVQELVKKYAAYAAPLKHITPHKLRSTFGTALYRETGDIYLVADVLGHSDVNTTKKHYAAISDDARRKAAQVVKLREDT